MLEWISCHLGGSLTPGVFTYLTLTDSSPWAEGGWEADQAAPQKSLWQQQLILRQVNIKFNPSFFTGAIIKLRISLGNHIICIRLLAVIVHFTALCTLPNSAKHCLTSILSIFHYSRNDSKCGWGGGRARMMDTPSSKGSITYGYTDIL